MKKSDEIRKQILGLVDDLFAAQESERLDTARGTRQPIKYAGRVYDANEVKAAVGSSLDFWLTSGPETSAFEEELAHYVGTEYSLFTNSGSSANLLAFMTLTSPLLGERRVNRGDEVITVAAGFPTTVAPIIQYGACPVFIDVELPTYNIDISQLESAMSSKTKAVMIAHTLGNPFNVEAVKSFCEKNELWLVEDNCDALGSTYRWQSSDRRTGTFGDLATSSFYPAHHITTGEGGAVYTSNKLLRKIALSLRDWGRDCWCPSGKDNTCGKRFNWRLGQLPKGYDHKYTYSHFGYNLKATDIQAAIGRVQLKRADTFSRQRRHNFSRLVQALEPLKDHLLLPKATPNSNPSWFGCPLTVKKPEHRNPLVQFLESAGIQTRSLFAGNLLRHPCFDEFRGQNSTQYRVIGHLPNTDTILPSTFWLGVFPGLQDKDIDYMAEKVHDYFKAL